MLSKLNRGGFIASRWGNINGTAIWVHCAWKYARGYFYQLFDSSRGVNLLGEELGYETNGVISELPTRSL